MKFLEKLRKVSNERSKEWSNNQQNDPLYFSNEFGGEAGEVQNVVKKLIREERGWRGSRSSINELEDEIADAIICLDNLANCYDIDLERCVTNKFNKTSEKNNLNYFL